jgi:hypothetical protein
MTELPPKSLKLLSLALCRGASEGEWHSAAIKAVAELRKEGIPVAFFEPSPQASNRKEERHYKSDPPYSGAVMPFGKFKGSMIRDLPDWYLDWLSKSIELRYPLSDLVANELSRRVAV